MRVCVCVCVPLDRRNIEDIEDKPAYKAKGYCSKGTFLFFFFSWREISFLLFSFHSIFFFFGYTICYIKSDSRCALGDDNYWNKIIHLLRLYIVYYISTFYMCFFFLSLIISHKKRTTLAQLASFTLLALLHDAFINIIIN